MSENEKVQNYFQNRDGDARRQETAVNKEFGTSSDGLSLSHRDKEKVPSIKPDAMTVEKAGLFATKEEKQLKKISHGAKVLAYDTQLELLRNQCQAALKEDVAFWDGKSEEVAEKINAYVTASLQNTEVERAAKTMEVTEKIMKIASQSVKSNILDDDLIPEIKDKLVNRLMEEMDKSINVIKGLDRTSSRNT